jgi:hypothetical protein
MFDNLRSIDYRRLLPTSHNDSVDIPSTTNNSMDYGIYEDEESIAQQRQGGETRPEAAMVDRLCAPLYTCFEFLPSLSLRERLLGCGTCMICGYLLSFGSFMRFTDLVGGNPVPLVVSITIGNVLTLCGTCFLTGPSGQVRRMWHETRRMATIVYLGSLFLTLLLLVTPKHRGKGFLLFCVLCFQEVASTWYVE